MVGNGIVAGLEAGLGEGRLVGLALVDGGVGSELEVRDDVGAGLVECGDMKMGIFAIHFQWRW
jgi:hypothetical protein